MRIARNAAASTLFTTALTSLSALFLGGVANADVNPAPQPDALKPGVVHTAKPAATPSSEVTGSKPISLETAFAASRQARLETASLPTTAAAFGGAGGRRQLENGGRANPLALRIGGMVSPRTKFAGGVDYALPSTGIGRDWIGRVDAEAIVSANLGGITTIIPVTFGEVYTMPERTGSVRFYGGVAIGPYFGEVTRFGGKLFAGANFSTHFSGEVGVHFSGSGEPLVTLTARVPL